MEEVNTSSLKVSTTELLLLDKFASIILGLMLSTRSTYNPFSVQITAFPAASKIDENFILIRQEYNTGFLDYYRIDRIQKTDYIDNIPESNNPKG